MLYYVNSSSNPNLLKRPSPPAQEAVHALERLLAVGMRFAVRLRPHPNLSVDGALSCGNHDQEGTPGRYQYRACPGPGTRLLRPTPRLLPQLRPGSEQTH